VLERDTERLDLALQVGDVPALDVHAVVLGLMRGR
jgi:hypothetical protein